jgi:fatty acid CoA ligase FadD9
VRTLVTGATGFLGRFLCLEWLERMASVGGKVICIARGRTPEEARQRIDEAFDSGDATLTAHVKALAAHLEVLPGDLGEPRLGLDEANWQRLAQCVDLIVHPAALVNHLLPYAQLFGPNVVGTAELIRLALTDRLKRFNNVSSVAVALTAPGALDEDDDIRVASPTQSIDAASYAAGYAASKWAAEVLLREAHQRFGLPVANFRCDMILPHSRYAGQVNQSDLLTRWLYSLLLTGVAPASNYRTEGAEGTTQRPHYDGLPVDFIAQAIAALGEATTAGHRSYHVVNPHDDGISLDTFVDWIIAAGYPIEKIVDYSGWLARFETTMRALPERQRAHSVLAVLDVYREPMPAVAGSPVPGARFQSAVERSGCAIPHVTQELIGKYLAELDRLGVLTK